MKRTLLIKFRGDQTQQDMSARYGVSQQAWSKWEQGLTNPSVVIMKRLEKDSGIPMEQLFPDVFAEADDSGFPAGKAVIPCS